ncbi:MAG TPA: MerR family transcriptional regulator [Jatrophihabitans sp.]|nr:MerR family transcriptional regulator [Jatrophihabitans sp.]
MENELLGIGRLAALSGLTVSAIRFYDSADVLKPTWVDPVSGYRSYSRNQVGPARLIARLRRISLPLDDIRTVLAEPALAGLVLDAHLARLQAGLADARREISVVRRLLTNTEMPMTSFTLPAAPVVRALREVRYAVGTDPELTRLHGVFLDSEPGALRVVATDRYRLATKTIPVTEELDVHLLLPARAVDALIASDRDGTLTVAVAGGHITVTGAGLDLEAHLPEVDFPAYRSWLELGSHQVPVDAARLRKALAEAPVEERTTDGWTYQVSRISVGMGGVEVANSADPDATVIGVNREFLLQALAAGDQLTLGLDSPIAPLAIRHPDDGTCSILMPVRLDQPA